MDNKLAVVFGGSGGIGIEAAIALYNNNFDICLGYFSNETKIKEIARNSGMQKYAMHKVDVRDIPSVKNFLEYSVKSQGQDGKPHDFIDVVVYSVSGSLLNKKVIDEEWETFQSHIDAQLKGMFNVVKSMKEQIKSKQKTKFIVLLSEVCVGKPAPMLSSYVSAKYALMGFAKSMAAELAAYNCTFNMVSPGMVDTGLLKNMPPKLIEVVASQNPMKRIANAGDVAKVIAFLASPDSDYLNGANIPVNGGNIMM